MIKNRMQIKSNICKLCVMLLIFHKKFVELVSRKRLSNITHTSKLFNTFLGLDKIQIKRGPKSIRYHHH